MVVVCTVYIPVYARICKCKEPRAKKIVCNIYECRENNAGNRDDHATMFKKDRDLAERSKALLKNKDTRTFKSNIIKQYPLLTEEDVSSLIPNKTNVLQTKLANRSILYSVDGVALFFDKLGRNVLYPTVHTLWLLPHMMRTIKIFSPVSEFILRGADLMAPGIHLNEGLEGMKTEERVCLRVVGNPLPFAVGDFVTSVEYLELKDRKGKAVDVLHVYRDMLCASITPPNSGFTDKCIYPTEDGGHSLRDNDEGLSLRDNDEADDINDNGNDRDDCTGKVVEEANIEMPESVCKIKDDEEVNTVGGRIQSNIIAANDDDSVHFMRATDCQTEDKTAEHNSGETMADLVIQSEREHMDFKLKRAAVLALRYLVKDRQLPLLVSTFWALVQKSTTDEHEVLDVRKSSFLKVSQFLNYCASEHHGKGSLLSLHIDEVDREFITTINRSNPLYCEYKVEDPDAFRDRVTTGSAVNSTSEQEGATNLGISNRASFRQGEKLFVLQLYKIPKHVRALLLSADKSSSSSSSSSKSHGDSSDPFVIQDGRYEDCYTAGDCKHVLSAYIEHHGLQCGGDNRAMVKVDASSGLYKMACVCSSRTTTNNKDTSSKSNETESSRASVGQKCTFVQEEEEEEEDGEDEEEANTTVFSAQRGIGLLSEREKMLLLGGGSGSDIKMKIRGTLKSPGKDDFVAVTPPQTSTVAAVAAAAGGGGGGGITRGSAAREWGVEKGTKWAPVSLPTPPSKSTTASTTSMSSNVLGTTFRGATSAGAAGRATNHKANTKSKSGPEADQPPMIVRRDDIFDVFLAALSSYYGLRWSKDGNKANNDFLDIRPGKAPSVKIMTEKRMGNKAVTLIRGLEVFGFDLQATSKEFQKLCACSVSVCTIAGMVKEKEIILQGNFAFDIESALVSQKGLPRSIIDVTIGKGVKSKR